jgi:general secretion pathway protein H
MAVRDCQRQAGFTLLELMVVLVLIGIIFGFAVLSLGGDKIAEAMEQETRRLVTLISLASDEAVIRGDEIAIHFTDTDYSFLVLGSDGWGVAPEADRLLKDYQLPPGVRLILEVEDETPELFAPDEDEDEENSLTPQVFILSSGEMTPFSVIFQSDQSQYRYHLTVSQMGESEWEVEEVF